MRRSILKLLVLVIFTVQLLSGCTWFSDEEEDQYREGFNEEDLVVPLVPSYPPHPVENEPDVNDSQLAPGFSYSLNWATGNVYSTWGGFISIGCGNSGSNDLFVYGYGIVVNWSIPSEWIYVEKGISIPVGEEKHLGLVYFDAPDITGNYSYNIVLSLLVKDNELYEQFNVESWFDNKTIYSKESFFEVESLEEEDDVKITYNYGYYHDKLNNRVDFEDSNVQNIVSDVKMKYPGDYNIYQALALFEYILNDLSYISDPAGRDYWCYPRETLARGGGDCEDFSILFSSMIGALGGTTRTYLTETHAFSVLYIGNYSQKNDILTAIEDYYGSEPNFVVFKDEDNGHWLSADPAGSLYLGGLPADAEPAIGGGFNFNNTTEINVIDIEG